MPIALIVVGLLSIIIALKGNYAAVLTQFQSDLTGSGNFLLWIGAILFLAIVGKVLHIPQASKMFIVLILAIYFVSNAGVLTKLEQAFGGVSPAPATPSTTSTNSGTVQTTTSTNSGTVQTTTTGNPAGTVTTAPTGGGH